MKNFSLMRALNTDEQNKVFAKIKFFVGDNIKRVLGDGSKLFIHEQRVLLLPERVRAGTSMIARKNLVVAGTVLGRFTKGGNFKLGITCLNLLSQWALYRIWIKNSAEMNYLYGNNSLKSHVFRISENVPINSGVFVFNQSDVPLGFGITTLTPQKYSAAKGHALVLIGQADAGEYVRDENVLA